MTTDHGPRTTDHSSSSSPGATGVIGALALVGKRGDGGARVLCDCQVVVDCARGASRRLTNLDLWAAFDAALDKAGIPNSAIVWTQSHVGTLGNEIADMAARAEARRILDTRARLYVREDGRDEVPPPKRRRYDPAMDGWEE